MLSGSPRLDVDTSGSSWPPIGTYIFWLSLLSLWSWVDPFHMVTMRGHPRPSASQHGL